MQFKPNFDLLEAWEDAQHMYHGAYVALFEKIDKTLVYMCDIHGENESFDMVDFCFKSGKFKQPDILITEFENAGREIGKHASQTNTLIYAAAVATKQNIPVVFADLSHKEKQDVLQAHYPNYVFDENVVRKILGTEPMRSAGVLGEMGGTLNKFGRDKFMLENIATALNKYSVVFAIFGSGHYESQRLALIDMMGEPKYIGKIPNTRGEFDEKDIKPIKLVDFRI